MVIEVLPKIGNDAAAAVAIQLVDDVPFIHFGLLVGIGGGVQMKRRMDQIFDRVTDGCAPVVSAK